MDTTSDEPMVDTAHAASVERSIEELQRLIEEQETALAELRATSNGWDDGRKRSAAAALEIMRKGYEDATVSPPFLPFSGSVLPALIALRKSRSVIEESRVYLKSQQVSLEQTQRRLEAEQANLEDQGLLTAALEKRIESLRNGMEAQSQKTPRQVAKEKMQGLARQKEEYDRETSTLLKALTRFIDDHLGAMLAAEDLGGPIVGDMMDVDSEELSAGFSAQGRLRKAKASSTEDKRQRRLDDIWGRTEDGAARSGDRPDEASAAGAEMRGLTEELLNAVMNSGGDSSAAYVRIERESAAARFLVRSKVAQFHPKDSTRLRLVDFGKEIDD